ncbi:hypothetical protein B566_EDAN004141 [Ephemera danica]|nr:hypothetical protein B566_EDAN004141 [Ephemera danica]
MKEEEEVYDVFATIFASRSFNVFEGDQLNLTRISRTEMGAYLCIATNGVPPSVSKRIIVDVEYSNLQGSECHKV